MSAGYGPPAVNTFGMIAGLGQAFGDSYDAARKRSQEDDAGDLFGKMIGMQSAPAAASPAPSTMGQAGGSGLPSFADTSGPAGSYVANLFKRESNNNTMAQAPTSSARGLGQFTKDTWNGVARKYPDLALTPVGGGQDGRIDPDQMLRATKAFTAENEAILGRANLPVNDATRYSLHFLGAGGGPKFVAGAVSSPDAPAIEFVRPEQVRANRSIFFGKDGRPKTAGEVLSSFGASFGGGRGGASAPTAVASADDANLPVAGGQTTAFQIPPAASGGRVMSIPSGNDASAAAPAPAAAPVAQGFPGMGGGTSRISPEQAEILKQAWKNPNTRAMATSVYQSILQGKDSPWTLQDVNGQSAWVNKQNQTIIPVGQAKRQTATVGNVIVDLANGQPIYSAPEKEDKFTYQSMPGVGMVALHPTNPDQSRVIIAGQQPRPLKPEERAAWGLAENAPAGMGADGKPFGIGGGKTEVNVDMKGAGKFAEKANEIQAKRYGEMVDAADNAVPLRADIDTMASLAQEFATGKLANTRLGLAQYAKAAGLDDVATKLAGGDMGSMEAFTALADKLVPRMRVPGSGSTSDAEGRAFRNSLPSLLKTQEGNALIADTFRGLADYQAQVGDFAGKALRGEISQSEADQAIKTLPSPYQRLKEYQAAARTKEPDTTLPIKIPATMRPEDVRKRFKSGTKIILPDGSEGVVP